MAHKMLTSILALLGCAYVSEGGIGLAQIYLVGGAWEAPSEQDDAGVPMSSPMDAASLFPNSENAEATARSAPAVTGSDNAYADFDFQDGTRYPERARIRIEDVNVPPGANEVHVRVTLDRATPNTVIARVMTRNGEGEGYAYQDHNFDRIDSYVIFRPGDSLVQTVRIPLRRLEAGSHFRLYFPETVVGADLADGSGKITAVVGAAPSSAEEGSFREPRRFSASGELAYSLDPESIQWSDGGSAGMWSTRLPHGRTQPGNQETGLYLDPLLHQSARAAMDTSDGELVLRSQQLSSSIQHEGTAWRHGAAVLTGERMPATQLTYGQYEWVARMPDRRGAWPALWLLPETGWPPEIDIYEGFGYSPGWNFRSYLSANLHGGADNTRTFTTPMRINAKRLYGIDNLNSEYHRFAVDIAPDFITWFVDGIEVYQVVNPFAGTTWFPLMSVAVKHDGEYVGGSGEMRVRQFRVFRSG